MRTRFTIEGSYHPDSRAVSGYLTFDGRSLAFRGDEGSEWASAITLAARVTHLELSANEQALVVWDGRRAHRVSGSEVPRLADTIREAIDASRHKGEDIPFLMELGEQLLGYGPVRHAQSPSCSFSGRLYLTCRRLHFEPDDAAMARGPLTPPWSAWHRTLRGSWVDSARQWWRVEAAGNRRALFRGEFALKAATVVDSMHPDIQESPPTPWVNLAVRDSEYPDLPLRLFSLDDMLALSAAGGESNHPADRAKGRASLQSLTKVSAHRDQALWRLHLQFEHGSWAVDTQNGWEALNDLVWAGLATAAPPPSGQLADFFEYVEPAVCWHDAHCVQFGWLAMSRQFVYFLPRPSGGSATEDVQIPLGEVIRGDSAGASGDSVQILSKGVQLVLSPAGGESASAAFWRRWEQLAANEGGPEYIDELAPSRLGGPANLVRLSRNGQGLLELADTHLELTSGPVNTISVLMAGVPDQSIDVGLPVRVEVARFDGVYAFDSVVWWVDRQSQTANNAELFRGYRILLTAPAQVARYNRRADYRVPVEPPRLVRSRRIGEKRHKPEPNILLDLSVGGCRLSSTETVAPHTLVEIEVTIGDRMLLLRGEVLHVFGPRGPFEACQLGVRFHQLDARDQALLSQEVMAQQRTLLREKRFLRERLEEAYSA